MNQNETIPILFQKIQKMSEEIKKLNDEIIILKKENNKIKQLNDEIIILKQEIKKLNDEIIVLKKSQIKPTSNDFKFKFKSGINYSLNENQTIAIKIKGGDSWNCIILGDTEIPKTK